MPYLGLEISIHRTFCRMRGSFVFLAWKSCDLHLSGWFAFYTGCSFVIEPNFNVRFSNSGHVMARKGTPNAHTHKLMLPCIVMNHNDMILQ